MAGSFWSEHIQTVHNCTLYIVLRRRFEHVGIQIPNKTIVHDRSGIRSASQYHDECRMKLYIIQLSMWYFKKRQRHPVQLFEQILVKMYLHVVPHYQIPTTRKISSDQNYIWPKYLQDTDPLFLMDLTRHYCCIHSNMFGYATPSTVLLGEYWCSWFATGSFLDSNSAIGFSLWTTIGWSARLMDCNALDSSWYSNPGHWTWPEHPGKTHAVICVLVWIS